MRKHPHDARSATQQPEGLSDTLRRLLSVVLTTGTAVLAVVCIHLDASGIQEGTISVYPLQQPPRAELEFAPLTTTLDLEPARALPQQPESF